MEIYIPAIRHNLVGENLARHSFDAMFLVRIPEEESMLHFNSESVENVISIGKVNRGSRGLRLELNACGRRCFVNIICVDLFAAGPMNSPSAISLGVLRLNGKG